MDLGYNLHKSIGDAHCPNDQDITQERNNNDALIEANQAVVLGQTVPDKLTLDCSNEVPIQISIQKQEEHFFCSIPDGVNMDPS